MVSLSTKDRDELASAHSRDIECVNGIWVMRIRTVHRSKDQRTKTTVSDRTMPLHSAILREKFLNYWRSIGDGPLFPQVELDGFGRRSGKMTAAVNEWLHETVKTHKSFYSHRHSFETFLRSASADPTKPCTPDIERYLMAHSSTAFMPGMEIGWCRMSKRRSSASPIRLAGGYPTR
jgi:integrase